MLLSATLLWWPCIWLHSHSIWPLNYPLIYQDEYFMLSLLTHIYTLWFRVLVHRILLYNDTHNCVRFPNRAVTISGMDVDHWLLAPCETTTGRSTFVSNVILGWKVSHTSTFFSRDFHFFLEILSTFTGIFLRLRRSEYSFSVGGTFLS